MDNKIVRISVGRSRFEKQWQLKEIPWGELKVKLITTTRTPETQKEYLAMNKTEQDKIKDVGGFVAAVLKGTQRRNGEVKTRTLITLDIDSGGAQIYNDLKMGQSLLGFETVLYSTHKHNPKQPRLRMVIPMTREITPDEYEAVARKVAELYGIGMDPFDDTTFQATRLMYWASTSTGAEFIGEVLEGSPVDPDEILSYYTDWRDVMSWPISRRINKLRTGSYSGGKAKAGEPTEKPGVVGAFNRVYDIHSAIATFIPEVYKQLDNNPNRYTYTGGSTAGGLIVYDDKFAYSNHGTDPASMTLCNAFDLIRIHKFGHLDDETLNLKINQRESYKKMVEWAKTVPEVGAQIVDDLIDEFQTAIVERQEPLSETEINAEMDTEWMHKIALSDKGRPLKTTDNVIIILENDPNLKGIVGMNEFRGLPQVLKEPPWTRPKTEFWTDTDSSGLRHYLESVYEITGAEKIRDGLNIVREKHQFDPVKDYIEAQRWDGVPRAESIFIDYFGAADTPYVRTVTRKMLVAAVARVYRPGIKFDHMVTIVGDQGLGKSLLIYRLSNGWVQDGIQDFKNKSAYEALDSAWFVEVAELVALKKTDRETIKNFISKTEDVYRKAYAENISVNKRRSIFIGTTNEETFLNDPTGARRFLVINTDITKRTKLVWEDFTPEEVGQIWAEVKTYHDAGEWKTIMEMPEDIESIAKEQQELHSESDSRAGIIEEYLDKKLPIDWDDKTIEQRRTYINATEDFINEALGDDEGDYLVPRTRVSAIEVWCECFGNPKEAITRQAGREINDILRKVKGWKYVITPRKISAYGSQRCFEREI